MSTMVEAPPVEMPIEYSVEETYTLEFVNLIRAYNGDAPLEALPRGHRGDAHRCVVAVSVGCHLNAAANQRIVQWNNAKRCWLYRKLGLRRYCEVKTPDVVGEFVSNFD